MTALEGCQIAVVVRSDETAAHSYIDALQVAGASVRACAPTRDLWSTLSDVTFDALLLLSEHRESEVLAVYDQLRPYARTRGTPVLFVTGPGEAMRDAIVLTGPLQPDALIDFVAELVAPVRRLRLAEQLERSLREQLRAEAVHGESRVQAHADLAHELRAVFGAALGFACNMRDEATGPLSNDQRAHVMGIIDALQRAQALLDKRPSKPAQRPNPTSLTPASAPPRAQRSLVQLSHVAAEAAALFDGVARHKSIRVRLLCDETVCVWGDALKLKQVVSNLLVNALKYTQQGGEVSVQIRWSSPSGANHVNARRAGEIVVSDNGPGIAPEYHERIFERGFRVEPNSSVDGQGIGLALVREIVLQHGGSVEVDATVSSGAQFRVSLPQDRRQRGRSSAESDANFQAVSALPRNSGARNATEARGE